jgi:uncharacterized protein YaaW (UPF0174 family)
MTKSEAAEILANYITVTCRKRGIARVTPLLIQELHTEALTGPGLIAVAAHVNPSWKTIRSAGRKATR